MSTAPTDAWFAAARLGLFVHWGHGSTQGWELSWPLVGGAPNLHRCQDVPADTYHAFMDAAFRRSGRLIYQPICAGCRACTPIRVPVAAFEPTKSQRRVMRKNADLVIDVAAGNLGSVDDIAARLAETRMTPASASHSKPP